MGLELSKERIEQWQVVVYASAVLAGVGLGIASPKVGTLLAQGLWPLLGVLLFVTFLQMPLLRLLAAFRHRSYIGAVFTGNFIAIPLLVWGLSHFAPLDPWVRLAFFLVMLVPCTDWFTTFTHLGGGDGRLALASTPILLVVQLALLPLYLWLFLGSDAMNGVRAGPFLHAFLLIILLPFFLALAVERLGIRQQSISVFVEKAGWLPVPLLGVVLFVIAASETQGVLESVASLQTVAGLFVAYLALAPIIGLALAHLFRLDTTEKRTLLFSLGTRNSFVVLPLVLAWPEVRPVAISVVVLQSIVELCGMIGYVALVPRWVRH